MYEDAKIIFRRFLHTDFLILDISQYNASVFSTIIRTVNNFT
jgi:hypothetical protein